MYMHLMQHLRKIIKNIKNYLQIAYLCDIILIVDLCITIPDSVPVFLYISKEVITWQEFYVLWAKSQ